MWSGLVTTESGAGSGWHHHGDHDTAIYVVDGSLWLEHGPGGTHVIEAKAGDFVHVPPGVIHRELNKAEHPSHLIVTRSGEGVPTINVDGPEVLA
jgi:uncharacterized RmlC-like cupin family protein